jgi:hypothetical protein
MIDKTLFLIWAIWYFNRYGVPPILFNFFIRFYYIYTEFFIYFNKIVYPEYLDNQKSQEKLEPNSIEIISETPKEPPKYEDKYLEDIRRLNKEWNFTEDENYELPKLIEEFCNGYIETKTNRIEEITKEIINLEKEIVEDVDSFNYVESCDEDGDELIRENTLEDRNEYRRTQIQQLQEEANKITNEIKTDEGLIEIRDNSITKATQYIVNRRLDKLKNCYVIEKTPNGNVLMIYDKERETFKYFSDGNIPYRYLEVVGRKYVKLFGCRPIFVDMEEELKLFEEKWDKEQELKKIKEEEDKKNAEEAAKNQQSNTEAKKKNIFAKFKSYNKDAGGKISMAAPPKNSIPNKSVSETKENEKILLKERANRYTYEGKFANFNFLQKIERKVFNKKLGLSFADFKKMKK